MPTLRDSLLPVIDGLRVLPPTFGLRRFAVTIRRRVWTGTQIGSSDGTATNYDIPLIPAPRVRDYFPDRPMSPLEAEYNAANNNIVSGQMYRIDRITPRYTNTDGTTGGYLAEQLRLWPNRDNRTIENLVVLVGDDGYLRECVQINFEQHRAFGYAMLVKEADRPIAAIQSLAVTPASPTLATIGATLQMVATGTFVGGAESVLTTLATWVSLNPAVATVGLYGVVTAVAAGTAVIQASTNLDGASISGSTTVTVA